VALVEAPALAPPRASLDVEDVLREGGFTRFHRKAVLLTGAAWTFVAMEILLVGFTVPVFTSIWGLSGKMAGWITASALAGSLVGSLVFGRLADRIGRRRIFQGAILWYALFTALTALAFSPGDLWVLAAVLSWAIYTLLLVRRPAGVDPLKYASVVIWCEHFGVLISPAKLDPAAGEPPK